MSWPEGPRLETSVPRHHKGKQRETKPELDYTASTPEHLAMGIPPSTRPTSELDRPTKQATRAPGGKQAHQPPATHNLTPGTTRPA